MSVLFVFITFFLQCMMVVFLADQLLTRKFNFFAVVTEMSLILTVLFFRFSFYQDSSNGTISTSSRILSIYLVTLISFKDSLLRKTLVYLLGILVDLISELISVWLPWKILESDLPYPYPVEIEPQLISMGKVICFDVMFILTMMLVIAIKRKSISENYSLRLVGAIGALGLAHFAFLVLYYSTARLENFEINDWLQTIFQLMLFSIMLFYYFGTLRISALEKRAAELESIREDIENDRRYFELADSKFEEISRIRHDIQNQLSTVRLMLDDESSRKDAEEIIKSLVEHLDSI
ncbi:MAG: hypothetical protein IIU25_01685 [Oscillospiraceae bacterium]|nr:hypothetical protein [Oscillospiraceae bacterium]